MRSISRPRDVGPARPERSPLLLANRAPRLKKRFNYFGGEPNIDESRRRAKKEWCAKNPSPARLKRDFTRFAVSKIEMKSQRATAAAERKRSRSEADTGRRTGASFGLCSCWYLGGERVARFPCQRSARSPRMRRGRTASFTGRLGLNIRSPPAAVEDKWAELLRLFGSRSSPPPHAADCYRLRASSAIPSGIAVLLLG